MLTAQEARKLAGVDEIQKHVENALKEIEEAAKKGERFVHLHDDFWVSSGYSRTKDYNEACERLRKLGYEVKFFYEERQFVNMYTVVKW